MPVAYPADTMTFDTSGLDIFSIRSSDGLTSVFTRTDDHGSQLNLGILRDQPAGPASLLALLRSAYAAGLLAAWTASAGYDDDGTPFDDVGHELAGV